jgi:hypothetical protein
MTGFFAGLRCNRQHVTLNITGPNYMTSDSELENFKRDRERLRKTAAEYEGLQTKRFYGESGLPGITQITPVKNHPI